MGVRSPSSGTHTSKSAEQRNQGPNAAATTRFPSRTGGYPLGQPVAPVERLRRHRGPCTRAEHLRRVASNVRRAVRPFHPLVLVMAARGARGRLHLPGRDDHVRRGVRAEGPTGDAPPPGWSSPPTGAPTPWNTVDTGEKGRSSGVHVVGLGVLNKPVVGATPPVPARSIRVESVDRG